MPSPIEKTITEIADCDRPLLSSKLAELTNMRSTELGLFRSSWAAVDQERRRQIMHRLVELAEDDVELNFDSIFKHCFNDQDAEVRVLAIEGLWENEEASLINPLIRLLAQDSSEKVQAAAATALGKYAMLAEHRKLRSCHISNVQQALLAVVESESKPLEVRCRALEAAGPLSVPEVKTAIINAYQNGDSRVRVSSVYAMGRNCDPCWAPMLLKELASADAGMRYEAACACGEQEDEAAVPHLVGLVNDSDVDVQMAAIGALGKIGGTTAKECLERCLSDSSSAVRRAAEQALSELEDREARLLPGP